MPDEVLSDGFAISARPVGTHAVLVEILGELDVPITNRDVHCVTVGVQQRRRPHPPLHLVGGDALNQVLIHRTGHSSPAPNGVRVPHGSAIPSR